MMIALSKYNINIPNIICLSSIRLFNHIIGVMDRRVPMAIVPFRSRDPKKYDARGGAFCVLRFVEFSERFKSDPADSDTKI